MARQIVSRVGEVYNGMEITEELGGNQVQTLCLKCGAVDIYSKGSLVNGLVKHCRACKAAAKDVKLGEIKNNLKVCVIAPNRTFVTLECQNCGLSQKAEYEEFNSGKVQCKKCAKSPLVKDRTGEIINGFKIVQDKGGGVVAARCTKCGAIESHNKAQLVGENVRCHVCGIKDSLYNEDITGLSFNGLQAIQEMTDEESGAKLISVKCLDCGERFRVKKGALISQVAFCRVCKGKPVESACPMCGCKISFIRHYAKFTCRGCGKSVATSLIAFKMDLDAYAAFNISKYLKKETVEKPVYSLIGPILILGKAPKYVGYDGMPYYDAMCTTHNKKLILSKKEIQVYEHDLCKCSFNMD